MMPRNPNARTRSLSTPPSSTRKSKRPTSGRAVPNGATMAAPPSAATGSLVVVDPSTTAVVQDSSGIVESITAALQSLQYPEPSAEWQFEVKALRKRIADLKLEESDVLNAQLPRSDTDTSVVRELREEVEVLGRRAAQQRIDDVEELINIANNRCNALDKLYQTKIGQYKALMPSQDNERLLHKIDLLESRVRQLEGENNSLRMRYTHEERDRTGRDGDLRKIISQQAREIELLKSRRDGGDTLRVNDYPHLGIEVVDSMAIINSGSVMSESHSGVKVKRAYGPAAAAGVQVGDFITWVITSSRIVDKTDFKTSVNKLRLKDSISLVVRNNNSERTVEFEVGHLAHPNGDRLTVRRQ